MNGALPVATPYGPVGGGLTPTLGGFISFVQSVMQPPPPFDATTSYFVPFAYGQAIQIVNTQLQCVPGYPGAWTQYAMAVYYLATDMLITFAQDPADAPVYKNDMPYWQYLRTQYGINSNSLGMVQSTSDQGTSVSLMMPEQLNGLTIGNLMQTKTPYGRAYLGIAGSWGTLWGLT